MGKKEKGGGGGAVSPDSGSSDAGAKLFKAKCATCHTANDGGPNKQARLRNQNRCGAGGLTAAVDLAPVRRDPTYGA